MWRHLYSIALTLALPLLIGHVVQKYRRQGHPPQVFARLGFGTLDVPSGGIWIHACSLGESKVALSLAREIREQDNTHRVWFSATTPTGLQSFQDAKESVAVFPWDLPWVWSRWLDRSKPACVVLIETELWPNLIEACRRRAIPVILANGRLSDRALTRYRRIQGLARPMWASLHQALMQSATDCDRARSLGARPEAVLAMGSIKLDQPVPAVHAGDAERLLAWKGVAPLVCLMSSHPGEEALVMTQLGGSYRLLLVPRHPSRREAIIEAAKCQGLKAECFSKDIALDESSVVIGDTFGDMGTYLSVADVVLIGGTWVAHGGQNPVEPALLAKPMVAGPWVFNFNAIVTGLVQAEALITAEADALPAAVASVLERADPMGRAAKHWVLAHQGATAQHATVLLKTLDSGH